MIGWLLLSVKWAIKVYVQANMIGWLLLSVKWAIQVYVQDSWLVDCCLTSSGQSKLMNKKFDWLIVVKPQVRNTSFRTRNLIGWLLLNLKWGIQVYDQAYLIGWYFLYRLIVVKHQVSSRMLRIRKLYWLIVVEPQMSSTSLWSSRFDWLIIAKKQKQLHVHFYPRTYMNIKWSNDKIGTKWHENEGNFIYMHSILVHAEHLVSIEVFMAVRVVRTFDLQLNLVE